MLGIKRLTVIHSFSQTRRIFCVISKHLAAMFALYANQQENSIAWGSCALEPSQFVLRGQDAILFALLREFKQKVVYKFISCCFLDFHLIIEGQLT